jgi:hypothetical protein
MTTCNLVARQLTSFIVFKILVSFSRDWRSPRALVSSGFKPTAFEPDDILRIKLPARRRLLLELDVTSTRLETGVTRRIDCSEDVIGWGRRRV